MFLLRKSLYAFFLAMAVLPVQAKKSDPLKWKYFDRYDKHLIVAYWKQYFTEDIMAKMDQQVAAKCLPLKFDSFGCIYPFADIFKTLSDAEMSGFMKRKQNPNPVKYSIYDIFAQNSKKLDTLIRDDKSITDEAYRNFLRSWTKHQFDYSDQSMDDFRNAWDQWHIKTWVAGLKKKAGSEYNHLVFFIHGYNVPYSLANLQLIAFNHTVQELQESGRIKKEVNTFYVPVFWPSNTEKKCRIEKQDDFNVENKKNTANGTASLHYANRAYYAAIGLRKVLNEIEAQKISQNISLITHSLGSLVATSALINTYTKLQGKNKDRIQMLDGTIDTDPSGEFAKKYWVNRELYLAMQKNPIPGLKLRILNNAPSMPGYSTFCDLEKHLDKMGNKTFYIGYNSHDEMLTKKGIKVLGVKVPFVKASNKSATSLGCDYRGEVKTTFIHVFDKNKLRPNFISKEVSQQKDHDVFTYINQPGFKDFLVEFYNGVLE